MTQPQITTEIGRQDYKISALVTGDPGDPQAERVRLHVHYMQMPLAAIPHLILTTLGHSELEPDEWPDWLIQFVSDNMPEWWTG